MKANSMRNLTLALTFNNFIKAGRNRGGYIAQKLLEMIINQSVAILFLILTILLKSASHTLS